MFSMNPISMNDGLLSGTAKSKLHNFIFSPQCMDVLLIVIENVWSLSSLYLTLLKSAVLDLSIFIAMKIN